MNTTIMGSDGKPRCRWCEAAPQFLTYHDTEWGFPVSDDHRLFEKLSLEGFNPTNGVRQMGSSLFINYFSYSHHLLTKRHITLSKIARRPACAGDAT